MGIDQDRLETIIRIFKAVSSPIRLKILALCSEREYTNRELRETLGISKPLLIVHLKKLVNSGLLKYRVYFDQDRMIVRKYYKTSENIKICLDKRMLNSIFKKEEESN